ncbi:MAG: DUF4013 domain-containing protein [Halobellus sp.]|uniref:DUF4013 domain-containing protein n=1 Tax=Halobellus sp. TaxID=1979212 RepID=UPI0035D4DD63
MFFEALRYPVSDRSRLDGTAKCLLALLLAGALLRAAARLWPDWAALVPLLLVITPILVFLGFISDVLSGNGFPDMPTRETLRRATRLLGVSIGYLLVPVLTIVAVGYVTGSGTVPAVVGGITTAALATTALIITIVCAYLLPAAAVTGVEDGLRAGLQREAFRGTASSAYFLAWVGATVLVVFSWSVLATTATRSVAALVALAWFAYAHVAAAALVAEGVERSRYWER